MYQIADDIYNYNLASMDAKAYNQTIMHIVDKNCRRPGSTDKPESAKQLFLWDGNNRK